MANQPSTKNVTRAEIARQAGVSATAGTWVVNGHGAANHQPRSSVWRQSLLDQTEGELTAEVSANVSALPKKGSVP